MEKKSAIHYYHIGKREFDSEIILARKIVSLPSRYILRKIKKNEDVVRFPRKFNSSQNKGYLYAASLVGREEGNSYWVEKEL